MCATSSFTPTSLNVCTYRVQVAQYWQCCCHISVWGCIYVHFSVFRCTTLSLQQQFLRRTLSFLKINSQTRAKNCYNIWASNQTYGANTKRQRRDKIVSPSPLLSDWRLWNGCQGSIFTVAEQATCEDTSNMWGHKQHLRTQATCEDTNSMWGHKQHVRTQATCEDTSNMWGHKQLRYFKEDFSRHAACHNIVSEDSRLQAYDTVSVSGWTRPDRNGPDRTGPDLQIGRMELPSSSGSKRSKKNSKRGKQFIQRQSIKS
jgi:hypothetical protein